MGGNPGEKWEGTQDKGGREPRRKGGGNPGEDGGGNPGEKGEGTQEKRGREPRRKGGGNPG